MSIADPFDLPGGFPERETDPRDDSTGWERPRLQDLCACGRAAGQGGKCVWCWHAKQPEDREDFASEWAADTQREREAL